MSTMFLRRKALGYGSVTSFVENMETLSGFVRNDRINDGSFKGVDLVVRWGCTSNVPVKNVLNKAEAIHTVNDKPAFRKLLQDEGDELVPRSYFDGHVGDVEFPVVVRPKRHAQGRKVFLAKNQAEFEKAKRTCGAGWYASEFIDKVAEYRVFVIQGRVAWVANKTPDNADAVAWNVARGGRFDNVRWSDWPLQAVRKSVEAFNLSGLDFGGVDVMVDEDGKSYIIEINSAPSHPRNEDGTPSYRSVCTAKCIDYITENGKEHIGIIEERGGYLKFIHPALTEKAKLP